MGQANKKHKPQVSKEIYFFRAQIICSLKRSLLFSENLFWIALEQVSLAASDSGLKKQNFPSKKIFF